MSIERPNLDSAANAVAVAGIVTMGGGFAAATAGIVMRPEVTAAPPDTTYEAAMRLSDHLYAGGAIAAFVGAVVTAGATIVLMRRR